MKSSIKWVIFTGLLAALFLIAACAPKEGAEEGAIAGQAQYGRMAGGGCSTVSGQNIVCTTSADSITVSPITESQCISKGGSFDSAANSICTFPLTACDGSTKRVTNSCTSRRAFGRTIQQFSSCKMSCASGQSCSDGACVAPAAAAAAYQCLGTIPENAHPCEGSEQGLTENGNWNRADYCSGPWKCKYVCNDGYVGNGQQCVPAPPVEIVQVNQTNQTLTWTNNTNKSNATS